ncbi:MAG: serine/threonine protein kinase [Bryobacterales bacterium]|nr:serine/threonine protein kinase [Bryobacterales bacterium]
MGSARLTPAQWARICQIASRLIDSPHEDRDDILAQECGGDAPLRSQVLQVCLSYSEDDDLFGASPVSPLLMEDSLVGSRIGPWEILRLLGEGGMGRVYLVERRDGVFRQFAALKLNREFAGADAVRRFHDERRIVAMLEHPSIARAIDGGATATGAPFLVMEYVQDGVPIDAFQPGNSVAAKIRLFLQVVEAVEVAHRQKIAHRDLKPSNILVTPAGLPKVLDFGIAKLFERDPSADQTVTSQAALTPAYASPEQLLHEPSSLASDVYSLGAVLYKMLSGRPHHDLSDRNLLQSVRLVTQSDPPLPSSFVKDVDGSLDAIVLKALDRNPARRYPSATEFAEDLRRYLAGAPVKAREGAFWYSAGRFLRRHRALSTAAAAVLVIAAIVGASAIRQRQAENQRMAHLRATAGPILADYQSQLTRLTGSTELRRQIAANKTKYLDSIYNDAAKDPALRRQVAAAYASVAYHQVERLASMETLQKSMALWRGVLNGPVTDDEKFAIATVARRVGLSQTSVGRLTEAGASLNESRGLLDSLPRSFRERAVGRERVSLFYEFSRLGAWSGKGPDAIRFARMAVAEHEKLTGEPLTPHSLPMTRMQLADVADTFGFGDKDLRAEALAQTRLAIAEVRQAQDCHSPTCRSAQAAVLTRAPIILAHHGLIDEALALRDGLDIAEGVLAEDPGNSNATVSLRFGLKHLGTLLQQVGRLEESLRLRRRLLELSLVPGKNALSSEDRFSEAIASNEVGQTLVALKRYEEALGYFERSVEIFRHPLNEQASWFMNQADVYRNLGLLYEAMGRPEAARAEFAKGTAAATTFRKRVGSALAREVEADAQYLQGKALVAVDKTAGCGLLRQSLAGIRELRAASSEPNRFWDEIAKGAAQAAQPCAAD